MTRTTSRFRTKPGKTSPMLHFALAKKIAKVAPVFFKMVQANDEDEWFKMRVWLLQYLIRDISRSPIVSSLMHMILKFSSCVWSKNVGLDTDAKHVRFALFASICFHTISKRYLEQTSSHLIGKLKSFVMARMSFNKHLKNPLQWTSVVESA